jgi:phosphatidylinositol dimannoside acyltransferase
LLRLLPDGLVYRAAHGVGVLLSFAMPERRALARSNLVRICAWLDQQGTGSARARRAAHNPRVLDALVRDTFGNWVRSYAEAAMAPRYDVAALRRKVSVETPDAAAAALAPDSAANANGRIYIGFHFGSVELSAYYAARMGEVDVAGPMEEVSDPALRAYFQRTRDALGVTILPMKNVARTLRDRLAHGRAVAIVADRTISGAGSAVELFGAPARLPVGPAVLAVESRADVFVISLRRTGWTSWSARVDRLVVPTDGERKAQMRHAVDNLARLLEQRVAEAPEQWWTVLFPIWQAPDASSE